MRNRDKNSKILSIRIGKQYLKLFQWLREEGTIKSVKGFFENCILSEAMDSKNPEIVNMGEEVKDFKKQELDRWWARYKLNNTVSGYTYKNRIRKKLQTVLMINVDDDPELLKEILMDVINGIREEANTYDNADELNKYIDTIVEYITSDKLMNLKNFLSNEYKKVKFIEKSY